MRLHLIDKSSLSYITHATEISVWFPCGTTHQVRFIIIKLDTKFPAVLGLDWLILHNPLINWADSSVTFQDNPDTSPVTTTQCYEQYFSSLTCSYLMPFILLIRHKFTCKNTPVTKHMSNMCLLHGKHTFALHLSHV
jgi:hypothetical protein